jgi:hypothetical protein
MDVLYTCVPFLWDQGQVVIEAWVIFNPGNVDERSWKDEGTLLHLFLGNTGRVVESVMTLRGPSGGHCVGLSGRESLT